MAIFPEALLPLPTQTQTQSRQISACLLPSLGLIYTTSNKRFLCSLGLSDMSADLTNFCYPLTPQETPLLRVELVDPQVSSSEIKLSAKFWPQDPHCG